MCRRNVGVFLKIMEVEEGQGAVAGIDSSKEGQQETKSLKGVLICVIVAVLVVLVCLVIQSYTKGD